MEKPLDSDVIKTHRLLTSTGFLIDALYYHIEQAPTTSTAKIDKQNNKSLIKTSIRRFVISCTIPTRSHKILKHMLGLFDSVGWS